MIKHLRLDTWFALITFHPMFYQFLDWHFCGWKKASEQFVNFN